MPQSGPKLPAIERSVMRSCIHHILRCNNDDLVLTLGIEFFRFLVSRAALLLGAMQWEAMRQLPHVGQIMQMLNKMFLLWYTIP